VKELLEKIKNENFRLMSLINMQNIEKQDFISQIAKQQEKENLLISKVYEFENIIKIQERKEENFQKVSSEYFEKEKEHKNIIKERSKSIEDLNKVINELKRTIEEKDNQILQKANENNNLYQIKSEYESKIVAISNEVQKEKDTIRELQLKLDIINSDFNLKSQLNFNQINHLNQNIFQLNNEIQLNKENYIVELQKLENVIHELRIEKELNKSQNEIYNNQIQNFKKNNNLKEGELQEKNNLIMELQRTIKKLNQNIHLYTETISDRDSEITKIYKYKEKFDKYTYIEKNLNIFSVINAADLNSLQNEYKKLYSINKENELQIENLNSINESLRSESQEYALLKEKYFIVDSELDSCKKDIIALRLSNCEMEKKNEEFKNEMSYLQEFKSRLSEQNKKLLLNIKLNQSNFNILNSSIDKNKQNYERFLYNSIEDLEAKNSEVNYYNIKLMKDLENEKQDKIKILNDNNNKDFIIKEQKEYIENLELNLNDIEKNINSMTYYRQCLSDGFGIGRKTIGFQDQDHSYFQDQINILNTKLMENQALNNELKSKIDLYEEQIEKNRLQENNLKQELLNIKNEKHKLTGELNNYRTNMTTINLKISNLENQLFIKDNHINAINYENQELRKNYESLRKQKEHIFEEISSNSKEAILKLNENKQIFIERIENLINENSLLKNTRNQFNNNLSSIVSKEISKDKNDKIQVDSQIEENKNLSTNNFLNKEEIFNESFIKNIGKLNNILSLLSEEDREAIYSAKSDGNHEENLSLLNRKFEVLRKVFILADKVVNNNFDMKLKVENLSSIIFNLQYKCELYQNRIIHLENLMKTMTEKTGENKDLKIDEKNESNENNMNELTFYSNLATEKKKEPQLKIINSVIISSSNKIPIINEEKSDLININQFKKEDFKEKTVLYKENEEKTKISFMETNEFLKKHFEVIRQNEKYRIINMELNTKITEIKKQNEELINKRFDSGITSSNTSKFFFEKYNELLIEKVNLENMISNDKLEFEKLSIQINNQNKEISNLKIEKNDLENLFSSLEKKFNEDCETNNKKQENLLKQIEELNVSVQNFQKEKANFNNVFNKIKNDKLSLENINKNNLTEITNLKENILHKDELLNNQKYEIEILNNKILEFNQQKSELENKLKSAGESKNNFWVRKLMTILYRSKGIIEMFIQLKKSFEEKIKNYENSLAVNSTSNGILGSKQGETFALNNIFLNAVIEMNAKMLKYDQEIKNYLKKEESMEKKIAQLNNEISILNEKENIIGNDYKILKEKINTELKNIQAAGENPDKPAGPGQEIKIYFSKLVQNITTAGI